MNELREITNQLPPQFKSYLDLFLKSKEYMHRSAVRHIYNGGATEIYTIYTDFIKIQVFNEIISQLPETLSKEDIYHIGQLLNAGQHYTGIEINGMPDAIFKMYNKLL